MNEYVINGKKKFLLSHQQRSSKIVSRSGF